MSTLARAGDSRAQALIESTAAAWNRAASEHRVEIRHLASICSNLGLAGLGSQATKFRPGLEAGLRARKEDSWIAAIQLLHLSRVGASGAIPEEDLVGVIGAADFSMAPNRVVHLANLLKPGSPAHTAIVERLLLALDGALAWQLDSSLLTWLLANGPRGKLAYRVPVVLEQVRLSSAKSDIRAACLNLLHELRHPALHALMRETFAWLGDGRGRLTTAAVLVRIAAEDPTDLGPQVLAWAIRYLREHNGDRSAELLMTSVRGLYRHLWRINRDAQLSGVDLGDAHRALLDWCASTGRPPPKLEPL